jgi:D-beta-D-heptose 7-phosphate kinase/D-beta-D-heptose 1-phosphate adenosyltransferase
MEQKARQVAELYDLDHLLVTQGDKGMTLVGRQGSAVHFPAIVKEVYDVTGAGDTVIAALAVGLASGLSIEDSAHLSSLAAGIVVGRMGTSFVTRDDILNSEHLESPQSSQSKILTQHELHSYVEQLHQQNKTVVFTNGCFDILHSGHIGYLEQAARLGDVLIVAVNSDESVRLLKGDDRPVNGLDERMAVLAGLASIDKVVSFEEETPERIICELKPDVLVKGGDYQIDEIAGRECVREVRLIDYIDGKSTTQTLQRVRQVSED